jgi:phage portal protein BeeE
LRILEQPWPGGTTGDLLTKMLVHADLAGNAFVTRRGNRLKILRPDWMTIVIGSGSSDEVVSWDPDADLLGYLYHPGGYHSGRDPVAFAPQEVAHFAPVPDPEAEYRGMSWLQPVISDIMGDQAATTHKLQFFENGATPNMVVALPISDPDKFEKWVEIFNANYAGASNAYKTMFLAGGADTKVVGATFDQMSFKETVGVSETRIAAAAGVPPVIVGLSEGLQGSSLNAGNYNSSRRRFADGTMRPLWRNVAGSLSMLVKVPTAAELWYDTRDIAFLREDAEVEASIISTQSQSMRALVDGGFEPSSVIAAVTAGDLSLLIHTGLLSVQVQEPGAAGTNGTPAVIPA